ncbi:hypothetical protein BOTCAL_0056g00380 [Botryotinia calthae]|uniref:Uncharacterized protein n=1 Tax=Botryotinia calthae TaxID=38488 RepID=A0A4Y8DAE0_9HELO|nr:hypothetical protein BOTCAL_0056g00380 [Botryotinia calthae]
MVNIELTSVETVSRNPCILCLPTSHESSSNNLASSVVAQSVERISQNEDDDLVTLPSAKLEEWLKHGIQILRESRQRRKTAGSDPEYEALENDPGLEYLDQPNVEVSSSRTIIQVVNLETSRALAQGEMVDKFLDRARRNPFHFREISAEPPVNFTIDTDELSGFPDHTTYDPVRWNWDTGYDKDFETSFEIAWEKYHKKLFMVDEFSNAARREWILILQKTWLRRRFIEIKALKDSIILGIRCAELLCMYDSDSFDPKIGSMLEFLCDSGVEWIHYIDIENVLALILSELMIIIYFCTQQINPPVHKLESPTSKHLRIDDLNAESLVELGGIRLIWTDLLEGHFLFNLERKELLLAWNRHPLLGHPARLSEEYCTRRWDVFDPEPSSKPLISLESDFYHSIRRTFSMLDPYSKDPKRFYKLHICTRSEEPTARIWKDTGSITSLEYIFLNWYHNLSSSKIEFAARNKSEIPLRTHISIILNIASGYSENTWTTKNREVSDNFGGTVEIHSIIIRSGKL